MSSFLDNLEPTTSKDDLTTLKSYCKELQETDKSISYYEEELKKLKGKQQKLSHEDIPNLLNKNGLSELKLDTGEKVIVKDKLKVSIPVKDIVKRKNALRWLIENGGANIIKKLLTIEEPERKIIEFLEKNEIVHENKLDVHSSTLRAWFMTKLGMSKNTLQEIDLSDIPNYFNIFVFQETKIK